MSQHSTSHIVMHRPHLLDLPDTDSLPYGYALRGYRDESDLEFLGTTLSAAFGDSNWDQNRVRSKLTEAPDVNAVYLVTWHDKPIATASSRVLTERFPGSGIVHWVGTHPEHARRGLASILIKRVLQDFLERGYVDAVLETDDFRIPALRRYLSFGFIPVYNVKGEDHRRRWSKIFQSLFEYHT